MRRVQETLTDPVFGLGKAMEGAGGEALQGVAEEVRSRGPEEMDAAAAPASLEAGQAQLMEAGGPVFGGTSTTYLAREYVWGNGDWGVDELLAQFDQDRKAGYPVQDAGGDVISLIDLGGGGGGTARTVANIVYDAYGRVIAHEHLYPHAYLRTGHKGLFFDRLDVGVADATTYEELPRLVAGSTLLGQNRNRTLNTSWGRFLQSDPNATGVAVQTSLAYHGVGLLGTVQGFDLRDHSGDTGNPYAYLDGRPTTASDSLGLESLPSLLMGNAVRATLVRMGARAMVGGMTATFGMMLFHDSGNDHITYGDAALVFAGGAIGEVILGPLGLGITSNWGAAGEIGAGGRMLADDIVLNGESAVYGVDYAGIRSGFRTQNIWEQGALDETATTGGGQEIMQNLTDPRLQQVSPGQWNKWQVVRVNPTSGERIVIHYSKNGSTGVIDDVKMVYRGN